jgi:hypothetical protein
LGRKQPSTTGNYRPSSGSSGLFILNQRPKPSRLGKLKHVGQLVCVNVATAVRGNREFGKHCGPAIGISDQSGLIIEFG